MVVVVLVCVWGGACLLGVGAAVADGGGVGDGVLVQGREVPARVRVTSESRPSHVRVTSESYPSRQIRLCCTSESCKSESGSPVRVGEPPFAAVRVRASHVRVCMTRTRKKATRTTRTCEPESSASSGPRTSEFVRPSVRVCATLRPSLCVPPSESVRPSVRLRTEMDRRKGATCPSLGGCLPESLRLRLRIRPSVRLSDCLSDGLSDGLSDCPPDCPSACLTVCPSACLTVCPSACLTAVRPPV